MRIRMDKDQLTRSLSSWEHLNSLVTNPETTGSDRRIWTAERDRIANQLVGVIAHSIERRTPLGSGHETPTQ